MSLAQALLATKQSTVPEIEIHLFEDCNLSCGFCSQAHDSGINFDFEKKFHLVKNFINQKKSSYDHFRISLMGGELFQDQIKDYTPYYDFILRVNELLKGLSADFYVTSNLVIKDIQLLSEFLASLRSQGINLQLTSSFDFAGRSWNQEQKDLFKKNVMSLKNYIHSISVTLHRPGIHSMLTKRDQLFEFLYDNFKINFDWYVPDLKNAAVFLPSDEDCKKALLYLAQNYPEVHPVKELIAKGLNQIQCCSENRILVAANDSISNCQYLEYAEDDFRGKPNRHSTYEMADRFIEEQGCATCEHIEHCGLYCYVAADYMKRHQNTLGCFIKEFYQEYSCR